MADLNTELIEARERRDALNVELGEALLSKDKGGAALTKRLKAAQAEVDDLERMVAAQQAAEAKALEKEAARAAAAEQAAFEKLMGDFESDHAAWLKTAGEVDALADRFAEACGRYEMQADALVEKFRAPLSLNANEASAAKNAGSKYAQVLLNLCNFGPSKMRTFLYSAIKPEQRVGVGTKRTVVEMSPTIDRLLRVRA